MVGSMSNYTEDKFLDHITGKTAFVKPDVWVGLSTADPLDDGSGLAEPVGNGYARVSTSGADWNASSGGATSNANPIEFPEATGDQGTITHFCLWDAETDGNMLAHADLTVAKPISDGDTLRFPAGELALTQT